MSKFFHLHHWDILREYRYYTISYWDNRKEHIMLNMKCKVCGRNKTKTLNVRV